MLGRVGTNFCIIIIIIDVVVVVILISILIKFVLNWDISKSK